MPLPVPALRLKLPPRPGDGTSRARHEGWRGDATESSRDRNVRNDADGSWDTSSADTEPSFDFAPVFDAPERSERGELGPPRDDAPRASRSASRGSETASEPSDAVPPDDPGLLRAMRRPRLAASSVAAFLSQRDGLRAGAWQTERAAETSEARADEASEAPEGSGDDRPDDPSLGAERTSGSPRENKFNKKGALPAALLEEGASSEARGRERRRGSRSRGACKWSARFGSTAAADTSAPDDADFVASAAAGNARRTEAAAELMTPTLGDAFVEEEAEERPDAKAKREAEEAPTKKEAEEKEAERATPTSGKADADADVWDLSRRLTVAEVASHYARKKADRVPPFRRRHPRETWNGGAPGLCRLAAPPVGSETSSSATVPEAGSDVNDIVHTGARRSRSGAPYATECFLSRSYTEGFGAPVAFAAYPSADVLCRACGDVAWDPVRFPKREDSDLGTLGMGIPADASNLWCRDCLLADGAAGERLGRESRARIVRDLPVDENVAARVALKRVLCRHALSCEREREFLADERGAARDAETEGRVEGRSKEIRWRMDPAGHGCPDSGRLCDREQTERDCSRAVRVCGLPGDANPGDACVARVRAGDFEAHAASCAFRLVACSRRDLGCARAVRRKHAEAHFRLCEHRPFACPNRPRCAWRGLRRDVEAHLRKACAWEVVPCGLVDDDRDGALARSRRRRDGAVGADGREYTFGGDARFAPDDALNALNGLSRSSSRRTGYTYGFQTDGNRKRKSLRSVSGENAALGRYGAGGSGALGSLHADASSGVSSMRSSMSSLSSLSSASRRERVERARERRERAETCGVRLARCTLNAHRAVCRFQRAKCRHCGAPRALRRLAQHEAECASARFACLRCGAERIPADARRTHDERVCPEAEVFCEFARYGCSRPRVPRREAAAHARARLAEHLALLLRRDANAPLPERTGEGDPYPALPQNEAEEGTEKTRSKPSDGFMALVTRHEVTRGDARRVAATASAAADGVAAESRALVGALGDAADAATHAREILATQIKRARARFATQCSETLSEVAEGDGAVEARAAACLSASAVARASAAAALADAGALDAVAKRTARETSAVLKTASDASRKLGRELVSLLAAAAPALDAQAEAEARVADAGAAAHERVARLEWTSADEAIVAWEKIGDAREAFGAKLVPRDIEHRALLLKVEALERGRYVSAGEDQAMRRRAREAQYPRASEEEEKEKPRAETLFRGEAVPPPDAGDSTAPPAPATPRGAGAETAEAEV